MPIFDATVNIVARKLTSLQIVSCNNVQKSCDCFGLVELDWVLLGLDWFGFAGAGLVKRFA